jgi:hypothetical protein
MPSLYACPYCQARGIYRAFPVRRQLRIHFSRSAPCQSARQADLNALFASHGSGAESDSDGETALPDEDAGSSVGDPELMDIDNAELDNIPAPDPSPSPMDNVPAGPPHEQDQEANAPRRTSARETGPDRYVKPNPDSRAGEPLAVDPNGNIFEDIRSKQEETGESRYGPFADKEMVEVVQFLVDCLGQGEADRFLKLSAVRTACQLRSFAAYMLLSDHIRFATSSTWAC